MKKMQIQSLGARTTGGIHRKVVITIMPGFWGRLFGQKAKDVTFYGGHRTWWKEDLNGPCVRKKMTQIINALVSEYENGTTAN